MKHILFLSALAFLGTCAHAGKELASSPRVEVTATFIQFDRDTVANEPSLREEGRLTHEQVMTMWKGGKGEHLSSMSVITRSGVSAAVQGVREITFSTGEQQETREVGHIFNVTPVAEADAERISLNLNAQIVELGEGTGADEQPPVFANWTLTTALVVANGETVVVGGGTTDDGKHILYLILSADTQQEQ